ncbi:MAG: alanine--tRNA ligase, partial [Flavobacteriales bacterium]|nr:alanine--tRNA ligase [Flavobacteriales bacterium]
MKSKDIRRVFLQFFKDKGHEVVASAPMVIKDDPTLMFTNAGMNQFKDLFLGHGEIKFPRVADSQKCLRVSGKHNDLEEVGVDTYHHTMFEMLGNWSFGDYFKKEAIAWAWELLTDKYKINPEDLYITYFEGDKKDKLDADTEALELWKAYLPEERILPFDKKDNFWEMGETGPCGPCSEIHIDLRSEDEKKKKPGRELVNMDHPQVIEIWNLVFMEFTRMADKSLVPLPKKHIDTGMGFERLAVVLQGKRSNYDTDVFTPLIEFLEKTSGEKYQRSDSKKDIAIRVISDHVRAVSFSIADGQLPSNTGAGYVIRRILRRAIRYAFSFLDLKEPFIYEMTSILVDQMGEAFPELKAQQSLIEKVIKEEEEGFLRTLDKGIQRLNDYMTKMSGKSIPGEVVFELYDTYGFPSDLTSLIAQEQGNEIDLAGFKKQLEEQKERSRAAGKIETDDWVELIEDEQSEFIGYDRSEAPVRITKYRKIKTKGKDLYQLVLNVTPFYPEGGGQVGDKGWLIAGDDKIKVIDTKKENNLPVHFAKELPKDLNAVFNASVDVSQRQSTARNHTATHLLHEALREVLGDHVEQKGSLVNGDYLRFDFSHFSKTTSEELERVEDLVNKRVIANLPLEEFRAIPIDDAKERGAMMLFGEKYGDLVRMIQFGSSKELCGGTHVQASGEIGLFRIQSEAAVAAGIRRIEAVSGEAALDLARKERQTLEELHQVLKQQDLLKAVQDLQSRTQELNKKVEQFEKDRGKQVKQELKAKIQEVNGVPFLAEEVDLNAGQIKDIAFQLKGEMDSLFAVFGSQAGGK